LFSGTGLNKYSSLIATKYVPQVRPSTQDPRIFDLDYWYSDCGDDLNAQCKHNPILKEQEKRRKARKKKDHAAEWGAYKEGATQFLSGVI
jgi:hypothetical protein